jgi:multimeric flavodoxin WrbA
VTNPARPRLLIVWTSMTGGTRQLAQAAAVGAALDGSEPETVDPVDIVIRQASETDASDLLSASGVLIATPENLGSMAGLMKDFFDRSYYAALDRIAGRPYAAIICAGSDGQGAARQIERIATGLRLRAIAEPLIIQVGAQRPEAILSPKLISADGLARARELGQVMAAGLSMGLW